MERLAMIGSRSDREKHGKWREITMQFKRMIVMGALAALPLLAQCGFIVRLLVADGVPTIWPT
jgi:hypothetical protein